MVQKKDKSTELQQTWLTLRESVEVISANSGHRVSDAYVRTLARRGRIVIWKVQKGTNLYRRTDVALIRVSTPGEEYQSKKVEAKSSKRTVHTHERTFTCKQCGAVVTQHHFSGHVFYCSDRCRKEANQKHNSERMKRFRLKKKTLAQSDSM